MSELFTPAIVSDHRLIPFGCIFDNAQHQLVKRWRKFRDNLDAGTQQSLLVVKLHYRTITTVPLPPSVKTNRVVADARRLPKLNQTGRDQHLCQAAIVKDFFKQSA